MSHSDSEVTSERTTVGDQWFRCPHTVQHRVRFKALQRRYFKYSRPKSKQLRAILRMKSNEQLLQAVSTNHVSLVNEQLERGANPDHADGDGRSALHIAVSKGYADVVKLLLENGANPNCYDRLNNTPLHLAACTHNLKIISLLLKAGADAKRLDVHGKNPLQLAESKLQLLQRNWRGGDIDIPHVLAELKLIITLITSCIRASASSSTSCDLQYQLNNLKLNENDVDIDEQMSKVLNQIQKIQID